MNTSMSVFMTKIYKHIILQKMYQKQQEPQPPTLTPTLSTLQTSDNPNSQQKTKINIDEITVLKRSKIANYPYYPVTHTLTQNNHGYIFNLDLTSEFYTISVHPFRQSSAKDREKEKDTTTITQLGASFVELECVPRKNVNWLYVLEYEDNSNMGGKSVVVKMMDFVIGFAMGFLIRCRYTSSGKGDGMTPAKRQSVIVGKYNKKPDQREGLFMRMSSAFFGTDQFYKVAIQRPVRSFLCHKDKKSNKAGKQKYNYSYLIGNRLYFSKQFTEQLQTEAIKILSQVQWQSMPMDSLAKLQKMNSLVIKTKRLKTLISNNYMVIDWTDQISCYIYTAANELIIADNEENKIIIYDVLDNLKTRAVYNFDLDVKKMNLIKSPLKSGKEETYLFVMPYDSSVFIINLSKSELIVIGSNHRSYITQCSMNQSGTIITGGCDHRIGIKSLPSTKPQQWTPLKLTKGHESESLNLTRYYQIDSSQVRKLKMDQTYFLGEFNNVNSQRNNSAGFGFGNYLRIEDTQLYAFITYDFLVKVYKIMV